MTDDPYVRTARLIYSSDTITKQQRPHGKVLNVMAAYGHLDHLKLIAELSGVSESDARNLVKLFRERVLGVTDGVRLYRDEESDV